MAQTLTHEFSSYIVNYGNTGFILKITTHWWQKSQSVTNNSSVIAYKCTVKAQGPWPFAGTSRSNAGTVKIWIRKDGSNWEVPRQVTVPFNQGTPSQQCDVTFSGEITVPHNADGTKQIRVDTTVERGNGNYSGDPWTWASADPGGKDYTLDTIPRATTPTLSASTIEIGKPVTITLNRASSAFTHTLTARFEGQAIDIGTGVTTSKSWTLPLTMMNAIPDAASGSGTITCQTYNGSTLIGTKTVSFTATVSSAYGPSAPTFTLTDAWTGKPAGISWLQSKSIPKVGGLSSTSQYGGTPSTYTIFGPSGAATSSGEDCTLPVLSASGSASIRVVVTDSRGFTNESAQTITVAAYTKPLIKRLAFSRCKADGTEDDDGTCVKAFYSFDITPLSNKNGKSFKIQRLNGSSWVDVLTVTNTYSADDSAVVSGTYAKENEFAFRAVLADTWETVTSLETAVKPSHFLINIDANHASIGFFRKASGNPDEVGFGGDVVVGKTLDVAEDAAVGGSLTAGGDLTATNAIASVLKADSLKTKSGDDFFKIISITTPTITPTGTGQVGKATISYTVPEGYKAVWPINVCSIGNICPSYVNTNEKYFNNTSGFFDCWWTNARATPFKLKVDILIVKEG